MDDEQSRTDQLVYHMIVLTVLFKQMTYFLGLRVTIDRETKIPCNKELNLRHLLDFYMLKLTF